METLEKIVENPFLTAILLTLTIAFILYLFFAPFLSSFPDQNIMFKAFLYSFLSSLFIVYLHSKTVKNFYEKKINEKLQSAVINKIGSNEIEVSPNFIQQNSLPQTQNNTNDFL